MRFLVFGELRFEFVYRDIETGTGHEASLVHRVFFSVAQTNRGKRLFDIGQIESGSPQHQRFRFGKCFT